MKKDALPFAASAKSLAELFGFSTRTIQRWDAAGMLTRLKGPRSTGGGKGAPVRYPVADFLEFLESQPGSRKGNNPGRLFERMGDILR